MGRVDVPKSLLSSYLKLKIYLRLRNKIQQVAGMKTGVLGDPIKVDDVQ